MEETNHNKMMIQSNKNTLKYLSLIILTVQNAALGLSMRYSRTREGDLFLSSTAVLMAEVTKCFSCLALVFFEEGRNFQRFLHSLQLVIIKNPLDTLKVCVPSFVYIIQNNLLYISASHLDAATYQVTYQCKLLTTAMFAVIILRRKLLGTQWSSLGLLVIGIILVQLANGTESKGSSIEQNKWLGLSTAFGACFLSGFAGVYFEKILKGSDISVWMRNVQLSLLSIPFGLITCFAYDGNKIYDKGFFFGYDAFVWYLVVLQAAGGLIVAAVVKYADNILKGFATSLAIVLSCIAAIYLFNFNLTLQFASGAALVIASIFLYGYNPTSKQKSDTALSRRDTELDIDEEEGKLGETKAV